jgi:hypothetical protein
MPLSSLPTPPSTPRAQRRRVKRGIVAAYIHEISARHQHGASTPSPPTAAATPPPAPVPVPAR